MGCVPTLERGNDKMHSSRVAVRVYPPGCGAIPPRLNSWTHLRQHDGFQGNETTGRWSAMGCVPTLERGNDKMSRNSFCLH